MLWHLAVRAGRDDRQAAPGQQAFPAAIAIIALVREQRSEERRVGKESVSRVRSRQKTSYEMRISYWSSYVCSSDLARFRKLSNERRVLSYRVAMRRCCLSFPNMRSTRLRSL